MLLFYFVVIAAGERARWLRRCSIVLAALLFVATLSRSGTLGAVGLGVTALIDWRPRVPAALALGTALAISLVAALLVADPSLIARGRTVFESPAAARLTVNEGSAVRPRHAHSARYHGRDIVRAARHYGAGLR